SRARNKKRTPLCKAGFEVEGRGAHSDEVCPVRGYNYPTSPSQAVTHITSAKIFTSPRRWRAAVGGHPDVRRLLYWRHLRRKILVRLKSFPAQVGVELAQLGCLAYITFVSRPGVFGLHIEGFIQRFRAEQIFHCLDALIERPLRVIRHLARDR